MIIKSKFVDYYDYVNNGIDSDYSTVYDRTNIKIPGDLVRLDSTVPYPTSSCIIGTAVEKDDKEVINLIDLKIPGLVKGLNSIRNHIGYNSGGKYRLRELYLLGWVYLLVSENINHNTRKPAKWSKYEFFNVERFPEILEIFQRQYKSNWNRDYYKKYNQIDPIKLYGYEEPKLLEVAKELNQPIFFIHSIDYIVSLRYTKISVLLDELPILKDIVGCVEKFPAQELYSKIEFFISNSLRDNPDNSVPVVVENKDRLVQHGFDLKSSFRHRKEDK